jgi:hypothetical protein
VPTLVFGETMMREVEYSSSKDVVDVVVDVAAYYLVAHVGAVFWEDLTHSQETQDFHTIVLYLGVTSHPIHHDATMTTADYCCVLQRLVQIDFLREPMFQIQLAADSLY